jgi:hypothetical protein
VSAGHQEESLQCIWVKLTPILFCGFVNLHIPIVKHESATRVMVKESKDVQHHVKVTDTRCCSVSSQHQNFRANIDTSKLDCPTKNTDLLLKVLRHLVITII